MAKAKFLVVYCLFISGLCCMANVTKDINMRFKDVRQGLSHQTVNCFYQDEFGFLWIGTQDGLNRFDGRKFEVFKPDNANPYSININNIRQVCGNKAGLLFIRSLQSVTLYDMRLNRFRVLRVETSAEWESFANSFPGKIRMATALLPPIGRGLVCVRVFDAPL